jgi:hypothetical protein
MRLLRKPERWMCLPASFAMALDIPLEAIFKETGHDGSEIVWPQLPEPMRRRGFHPQELVHVCLSRGYAATPVELFPVTCAVLGGFEYEHAYPDGNWARFTRVINQSRGVLTGSGSRCGHAVAYEHGHIFDPDGCEYDYSREACEHRNFHASCLWRLDKIGGCDGF